MLFRSVSSISFNFCNRVFFILTIAAAEVAVGLAIIVALFRHRHTVQVEELNQLKH